MKKWMEPEMKELSVTSTEGTYVLGNDPDGDYICNYWPLNSTGCVKVD